MTQGKGIPDAWGWSPELALRELDPDRDALTITILSAKDIRTVNEGPVVLPEGPRERKKR